MHQPKGGMCANCNSKHKDCSGLNFDTMPVIEKHKDALVVRCVKFDRVKK